MRGSAMVQVQHGLFTTTPSPDVAPLASSTAFHAENRGMSSVFWLTLSAHIVDTSSLGSILDMVGCGRDFNQQL